jgi:plastocyanin
MLAHASSAPAGSMAGMRMPMSMPMGRTAAAPPVVELHRKVVYVHIQRFAFHPARIVVSPGTRVVWDNRDSDPHTVHSGKGRFSSEALDTHGRYSFVVKRAGTFSYICTIHPFMHGVVTVRR